MKKYTVYEIEKLTDGKLSKYKLTRAIENGDLVAEAVKGNKKGRGVPKYFVYENELDKYLKKVSEARKKKIKLPGDEEESKLSEDTMTMIQNLLNQKDISIQALSQEIESLKNRISILESQSSKIHPLVNSEVSSNNNGSESLEQRKKIINELATLSPFAVKKKRDLLTELSELA